MFSHIIRFAASLLFTIITLMASQQVSSFSGSGHHAIANVAWALLTKEAQQSVRDIMERSEPFYSSILGDECTEKCSPLATYAKVRRIIWFLLFALSPFSLLLHYIILVLVGR